MLKEYGIDKSNYSQNADKIEGLFRKFNFTKAQVKSAIEQIEAGFGIAKHIPVVSKHLEGFDEKKVNELKQGINKILKLDDDYDNSKPNYDFTKTEESKDSGLSYGVRSSRASRYPDF